MSSRIAELDGFVRSGASASDRSADVTALVCRLMASGRTVKLALTGTAAGLFSGLFGVGGGTVMVPLLVLWMGYEERRATGTSLAAIIVIAAMATLLQGAYGNVDVVKALVVGLPAIGGVLLGTWAQQRVNTKTLGLLFALVLVGAAVDLILT